MSHFYARYAPPTVHTVESVERPRSPKRKRAETEDGQGRQKKSKKKRVDNGVTMTEVQQANIMDSSQGAARVKANQDGSSIISKRSALAATAQQNLSVKKHIKPDKEDSSIPSELPQVEVEKAKKRKKEKKSKTSEQDQSLLEGNDNDHDKKHAKVLSKFGKSKAKGEQVKELETAEKEKRPIEKHGLEPIPQPTESTKPKERPAYLTLPTWQHNAIRVDHKDTRKFQDLGLSNEMVLSLQKAGIEESFPVQTTVLPLLLEGPKKHFGDLCVSAATGSGKTLAYVLPLIEDIKQYPITGLRGIIVVPTRELVKQVRQLCDVCVSGTHLKIATATGSKSLKDEQANLVLEEHIYDPREYEQQRRAPIDWSTLSMEQLIKDATTENPTPIDHVKRFRSKVDILITTPGRLVDHLQSTPGFNVDYVRWLVVDEADRLLNESYQEWIDVVNPALQSLQATKNRDELLHQMRIRVPERTVQKVLVSATMTRDISKLNSLGLVNPKLVVLGNVSLQPEASINQPTIENSDDLEADREGAFRLPSSLSESIIPVKESSEKPLYLLDLLKKRILRPVSSIGKIASELSSAENSSTDSDSSVTDSTSSSGSESEDESPSSSTKISLSKPEWSPEQSIQPRALIFTRSTASAERLSRLLSLLSSNLAPVVSTLTRSTASSSSSRHALQGFRSGRTAILIATDRASRGLDIPDLEHVISYDVPSSALTYVHRVGRTARAGKAGTAWTLVEHREGAWFWREIGGKDGKNGQEAQTRIVRREKPSKVSIELDDDTMKEKYEEALKQLGEEVRG